MLIEQTGLRSKRSKHFQDDADPTHNVIQSVGAPLHFESVLDSGNFDTEVDFTPQRVNTAQFDGWTVNLNNWHYALGIDQVNHPGEDGWFGFGGRQGQNWLKLRLEHVGYLRWNNLTWTDLSGLPTYDRANLSSSVYSHTDPAGSTIPISAKAEWHNLWSGNGEAWIELKMDGDRLEYDVVLNQAGVTYAKGQYPGTAAQQSNYYFGFVFRLDASDVPQWFKNGTLQNLSDFDDDDGSSIITANDAVGRLLFMLPLDNVYVRDPVTGQLLKDADDNPYTVRLRKRIYTQNGDVLLLVGARVDLLNALPDGDLVFDPTLNPSVGAGADDGNARSGNSSLEATGTTVYAGYHTVGSIHYRDFWFRFTGISGLSGATINSAVLWTYVVSGATIAKLVSCEKVAAPTAPSSYSDFTGKTRTTANTAWDGTNNQIDVTTAVQELADNFDPSEVQVLSDDNSQSTAATSQYQAASYESGSNIAYITIDYTAGGGSTSKSVADTGSGVDALGIGVMFALSDSGSGVESMSGQASLGVVDSGSGLDALSQLLASLGITDSGSGLDGLTVAFLISILESGSGLDALSLLASVPILDTASGNDVLTIASQLGLVDLGAGLEALDIAANVSVLDSGSGVDAPNVLKELLKSISDIGLGSDAVSIQAALSISDVGNGVEALTIDTILQIADTGLGTDAINVITATLKTIADIATGSDTLSVSIAPISVVDSGVGQDVPVINVQLSLTDLGAGADIINVIKTSLILVQDIATGTDIVGNVTVALNLADSGMGSELLQVLAALSVVDLGSGVEVVSHFDTQVRILYIDYVIARSLVTFSLAAPSMTFDLKASSITFSLEEA